METPKNQLNISDMAFDWVSARSKCSLEHMFHLLGEVVDSDVKAANELKRRDLKFTCSREAVGKVIVTRERNMGGRSEITSVAFEIAAGKITVREATASGPKKPFLAAIPGLNEEGECLLDVDGHSFKLWQVSRKALERLFFEF